MNEKRYSYVLAMDEHIPAYCADCENELPEAGQSGPWLYRMSVTEHAQFRVDALCVECGAKHVPALVWALAAVWQREHELREAAANAH
jgi:hypothetical protein